MNTHRHRIFVVSLLLLVIFFRPAATLPANGSSLAASFQASGTFNHLGQLTAPDGEKCTEMGNRMAMNSHFIAASSWVADLSCATDQTNDKVYIFERQPAGWNFWGNLTEPGEPVPNRSITGLAIDENRLVVAYASNTTWDWAVYIYKWNGTSWLLEEKISAPDPAQDLRFGSVLSISGDRLAVGAPGAYVNGLAYKGAAFLYAYDGNSWQFQQKITDAGQNNALWFGQPLLLQGNTLYAGYPDAVSVSEGKVNIYTEQNDKWSLSEVVTAPDAYWRDNFGKAIAVDGDQMVIGADQADTANGIDRGAAYLFRRENGTWVFIARLTAPDGQADDAFGGATAIQGNTIVVGAYRHRNQSNGTLGSGAAYIFQVPTDDTQPVALVQEITETYGNFFSSIVRLNGNLLVIASPFEQVGDNYDQGAVHLYYRGISHTNIADYVFERYPPRSFSVGLDSPPIAPVTLTVQADIPLKLSTDKLTFTPEDWSTPQEVLVEANSDCLIEDYREASIHFAVKSMDANYNQMRMEPMLVRVSEKVVFMWSSLWLQEGTSKVNYLYPLAGLSSPVTFTAGGAPEMTADPNQFTVLPGPLSELPAFTMTALDDKTINGTRKVVFQLTTTSQELLLRR